MSITFGGLASGLDTNAIITQLVALERRPIEALQLKRNDEQQRLDLVGTLERLVKDLQTKAEELGDGGFFAYDLQVASEGVANFQLTGDAPAAAHTLDVTQLAAADRYRFDAVADPDASLGEGNVTFSVFDDETGGLVNYDIDIVSGTDSLNDIAATINANAGDSVTASVINTGTEASPSYQLVLTGNQTGSDYAIQDLSVSYPDLGDPVQIQQASNAQVTIDGLQVERSTNLFNDVLEGISFTVTQAGGSTSFTVEANSEGIQTNLDEFAASYNAVIDFINGQQEFSEEAGQGGLLFGDSILDRVKNTLQGAVFDISDTELLELQSATNNGFVALNQIGISFDSDGRMELDDDVIEEKLGESLTSFANLLVNDDGDGEISDDDGAFVKLTQAIETLVDDSTTDIGGETVSIKGLFDLRRDTAQTIMGDIDDEIERLEFGVERFEESLVLQFARLEELIGQLNAQGAYLSSGAAFPT